MARPEVTIVGLDGVPPALLAEGISRGRLPTLERLWEGGVSGRTRSTLPPISMLAWSTFATGRSPGNHGIYNFMLKEPDGNDYRFADSSVLRAHAIPVWEYLHARGMPTGVVNVMPGYPPSPTRAYHVSDHVTTPPNAAFASPEWLQAELDDLVDGYDPTLPSDLTTDGGPGSVADYLARFFETERENAAVADYLLGQFDTAFTTIVFSGPDVLLHNIGHLWFEDHSLHDEELAEEFGDAPIELLEIYDEFIADHLDRMAETDVLFVLSDHGHGPIRRTIDLNSWLYRNGYLRLRRNPWTMVKVFGYNYVFDAFEGALRRLGQYHRLKRTIARSSGGDGTDLARLLTLSQNDIDWDRTDAFTISADGQIFLTEADRSGDPGPVEPPATAIERDLAKLRDPETGESVVHEVLDGNEVYEGTYRDTAPDLIVVPEPGYEITFPQTMQTKRTFRSPEKPSSHTSLRERDGMFLCWGGNVDAQSSLTVDLVEFAPTALALLDVPVPTSMDGSPRMDLFASHPPVEEANYDGLVTAQRAARRAVRHVTDGTGTGP